MIAWFDRGWEIYRLSKDDGGYVGIGRLNEGSLHSQIKRWYAQPGDSLEVSLAGFVVDIVRGDLLIEIQTGNFSSIRDKLRELVKVRPLRLVYPIAEAKWIRKLTADRQDLISRRKSPKKGRVEHLFDELVRIPKLICDDNFAIEVLLIHEEEIRSDDGQGSWRRRGVSILDHKLLEVVGSAYFCGPQSFLHLLPEGLAEPFTTRALSEALGLRLRVAQRMSYCLRHMGAVEKVGQDGRAYLYAARR